MDTFYGILKISFFSKVGEEKISPERCSDKYYIPLNWYLFYPCIKKDSPLFVFCILWIWKIWKIYEIIFFYELFCKFCFPFFLFLSDGIWFDIPFHCSCTHPVRIFFMTRKWFSTMDENISIHSLISYEIFCTICIQGREPREEEEQKLFP